MKTQRGWRAGAGKENSMRKYNITEATVARINAAKAVKSEYMTIVLPGEGRVMKSADDDDSTTKTVIGGLGKIADTGEVFQAPLPFEAEAEDLAEDDEEIVVNTLHFDKMIEMCGRSGGGVISIIADEGIIAFRCGQAKGDIRYFDPEDVPFKPAIETKGEPVATFVLKSEAVSSRVKFISSYADTAIDIRISDDKVKLMPDLSSGMTFAESVFAPAEIIDLDYKKGNDVIDFVIPSKYREFFTLPIFNERMTIKIFEGSFAVNSNGAMFKGALSSKTNLIPESAMKKLSIKNCEVIAVFLDRQKFVKESSVSSVWADIIGQSTQSKIMKIETEGEKNIKLSMTDSFESTVAADKIKNNDAAEVQDAYYVLPETLNKAVASFAGETLTLALGGLKSKTGLATLVIVKDGAKTEKGIAPSGNTAVFMGATEDTYKQMSDVVTARKSKSPKTLAEEAKKEAEKKEAEKASKKAKK